MSSFPVYVEHSVYFFFFCGVFSIVPPVWMAVRDDPHAPKFPSLLCVQVLVASLRPKPALRTPIPPPLDAFPIIKRDPIVSDRVSNVKDTVRVGLVLACVLLCCRVPNVFHLQIYFILSTIWGKKIFL